jgi:hypothetical protein
MPNIEVKLRRGTTAQHSTFTGAEGEVTVDTDKDTVVVHDGTTAGGHELRRKDDTIATAEIDDNAVTSAKISATDTNFNVTALGKVGIGKVNSGSYQLEIDGDILIEDSGDNNPVAIFSGSSGSVIQLRDSATTGSDNGIYNIASDGGKFEIGSILDAGGVRTALIRLHPKGTTVTGTVLRLEAIDVANLNAAETGFTAASGMIAYVQDGDSGSPCLAVHDGTSFKRVALGTTISAT